LILLFFSSSPALAQTPLLKEAISREVSILVVSDPTPVYKEAVSREVSVFASSDPTLVLKEAVSREVSLVVQTFAVPAPVTPLTVDTSTTGDRATLDWSGYNEVAQHDVARYAIYGSEQAFTNVAGLTPATNVLAGTFGLTLSGLAPWRDRYFAVVAVDTLGGFDPGVTCVSAYVLAREAISREVSVLAVSDPALVLREAVSREVSLVVASTSRPARVTGLTVDTSPTGDRATLDWSSYNEVAQHDVARYDVYWSSQSFTNVTGLTPGTNVLAGTFGLVLTGLAPWQDRYFAVVPVDVLGGFDPGVQVVSAYVLAREAISREVSVLAVSDPTLVLREAVSREVSILVPDSGVPAPVCYVGSPFSASASAAAYQAMDLSWTHYNEVAQHDVWRYRVYISPGYFNDVSTMQPHAFVPAGTLACAVTMPEENTVYAVAVVAEDVLGQWNPSVHSVFAASSAAEVFPVSVRVWLQGPFDPTRGAMGTALQPHLPLISPYAADRLRVSSIDTNVTDWVLGVLCRSNGAPVAAQSAWLRRDGAVVSPGHTQMLWKVAREAGLYLALQHRNHLAGMSAAPLVFTNQAPSCNLATNAGTYVGGTNACVPLAPGAWGLRAGDADGDGRITPTDRAIVTQQMGKTGYLSGDLNLDGKVDGND
jgi:hypothetical protein